MESAPKEIEQSLLEEKLSEQKSEDPAAIAAGLFGIYLPRFQALVWKLSSKARARVLTALIESPLQEGEFTFSSKEEKECFLVGEALLQAKFMLVQATFMENNEALKDALAEPQGEAPVEQKGE